MLAVYFLYGLAFFGMGLAVALESRRASDLVLSRHLRWLAAFGQVLGNDSQILRIGTLKECYRCKHKFADHIEGNLCSVCAYRKANPFGSRMPLAVKSRAQ